MAEPYELLSEVPLRTREWWGSPAEVASREFDPELRNAIKRMQQGGLFEMDGYAMYLANMGVKFRGTDG